MSVHKKPVLLDGAIGTSIWAKVEDKLPVWTYNITRPDVVEELCHEYIAAGSKMILANTFGANRIAVERASDYQVVDVVSAAVRIAKKAAEGTDVKVCLSIGPLSQFMEPYGDLEEEEAADIFHEQIDAGMSEHPDAIVIQTFMDLEMMRVAAQEALKYNVPVYCCMTFEEIGKTMFGNTVEDTIEVLEPLGIAGIGLNCSLGPDKALPIIKEFSEKTSLPIYFKPNAGKPILAEDGATSTPYTAQMFADEIVAAFPYVDYVGGCCGSDPQYMVEVKKKLDVWKP